MDFINRLGFISYKGKIALVCAHDVDVLEAASIAKSKNLADFVFIGVKDDILTIAKKNNLDIEGIEIIDESSTEECAKIGVSLVKENKCNSIMKGLLDTSVILKAVLNKDCGLRRGRFLSHVGFFMLKDGREYIITDAAVNIAPDKDAKKNIIENAVEVAMSLGYEKPNVACLCAKETVDQKMIATLDAEYLRDLCLKGVIENCNVSGPLALDNAVSKEAAVHKNINDPVAGYANILLAPDIEAGNILYKSITFMGDSSSGSLIMGASCPIVLTSRSDSMDTKLNSIALASKVASVTKIV